MSCFVPDCAHHRAGDTCSFQAFPHDAKLKKKWIQLIRCKDREPYEDARVCSCHFLNSDFRNLPSIFARNEGKDKTLRFPSPEKRTRKRRRRSETLLAPPCTVEATIEESVCLLTSTSIVSRTDCSPILRTCDAQTNTEALHTSDAQTNTEALYQQSALCYEAEIYLLKQEIAKLQEENRKLKKHPFGFFTIEGNDALSLYYTGLHLSIFEVLQRTCLYALSKDLNSKRVKIIPFRDQFLLTLMKLRINAAYIDLATRFGVSYATVQRVLDVTLPILHKVVFLSTIDRMPSVKKNQRSLPICFSTFTRCRCVVDCTEVRCEIPKNMLKQKLTFSSYKHYNSLKPILAVAPNGACVFCSEIYPGSTSDKEIFKHCGIIKQLEAGDLILADKGFLIADLVPTGVSVNIPPFLNAKQFTVAQIMITRNIARARIHVERLNCRLKRYKILQLIPQTLFKKSSMILQICAGLINFQNPLLKEVESDFYSQEVEDNSNASITEFDEL